MFQLLTLNKTRKSNGCHMNKIDGNEYKIFFHSLINCVMQLSP